MALAYLALSLAYSLSQLKSSFLSKCDHGHTALLTHTREGFWSSWENILFLMALGDLGEKLHMMILQTTQSRTVQWSLQEFLC